MSTHIENIRVGNYIAVSKDRELRVDDSNGYFMGRSLPPAYSGEPLYVLGISLPFVCVGTSCGRKFALDLRRYEVSKLSRKYVNAMLYAKKAGVQVSQEQEKIVGESSGGTYCNRCGERAVTRLLAGERDWKNYCRGCNRYI